MPGEPIFEGSKQVESSDIDWGTFRCTVLTGYQPITLFKSDT